jgi:hypothetical protein
LADDEQPTETLHVRVSLAEIRSLPHYVWESWPFDEYDQGNPVMAIRQADSLVLVGVARTRRRRSPDTQSRKRRELDRGKTFAEQQRGARLEEKKARLAAGLRTRFIDREAWLARRVGSKRKVA